MLQFEYQDCFQPQTRWRLPFQAVLVLRLFGIDLCLSQQPSCFECWLGLTLVKFWHSVLKRGFDICTSFQRKVDLGTLKFVVSASSSIIAGACMAWSILDVCSLSGVEHPRIKSLLWQGRLIWMIFLHMSSEYHYLRGCHEG